jgi:hypothetical protein
VTSRLIIDFPRERRDSAPSTSLPLAQSANHEYNGWGSVRIYSAEPSTLNRVEVACIR